MKFFFYSVKGFSLSLAQRVRAEGNQVVFFQESKNAKSKGRVGQGIVPLTDKLQLDPDTIVVFDFTGAGKKADAIKERGFPVVGGSVFNDALEKNRFFSTQLMRAADIKTPTTAAFSSIEQGVKFAERHPKPLVFKPSGDQPPVLTIIADDNKELVKELQRVKRVAGDIPFELQERVEGIEVSIEGWFNGQDWIFHSINSTLEEKRFLTGGLGPNTGCMGNVVFFYRHARPRFAKDTLFRLTSVLRRADYRGPLDINTKGGFALEFTPRFGYDAIQALTQLLDTEVGRVLSDTARGQAKAFKASFDFAIGVTMTIPPFPGGNLKELGESQGMSIRVPDALVPDFHLGDAMIDTHGDLVSAGNDGVAGVLTAVGDTVSAARRKVYANIKELKIPDVQYRLDIGERAVREVPTILREAVA